MTGKRSVDLSGGTPIVEMLFGSDLYGTAIPGSDKDFKGVFIPSRKQVLLGRIPRTVSANTGPRHGKNVAGDVDVEWHSLHHFIRLACEGQTMALDMLFAPPRFWLTSTTTWDDIVKQRERFLTRRLEAFVGYARRQAAKYGIKGSRLDAARRVMEFLRPHSVDPGRRLCVVWDELPEGEHLEKQAPTEKCKWRAYQVCGKKLLETTACLYALEQVGKFVARYGERARMAARNEGIDWKAVSHALRAAYQLREILTERTITFPRPEAAYLSEVKAGILNYLTDVAPRLEDLMVEVEQLSAVSTLPEEVDGRFWDEFVMQRTQTATLWAYEHARPEETGIKALFAWMEAEVKRLNGLAEKTKASAPDGDELAAALVAHGFYDEAKSLESALDEAESRGLWQRSA